MMKIGNNNVPDGAVRGMILYNDMRRQGIKPRSTTFELLIDIFTSRHRYQWMKDIFQQYLQRSNTKQVGFIFITYLSSHMIWLVFLLYVCCLGDAM
jgi:hypothetical protein